MILGLLILGGGALLLIPLENWVHRNLSGAADFLAEHAYLPMARSLVIVLFLFAVYPTPLLSGSVLDLSGPVPLQGATMKSLLNWMFLAGIALPLLPTMQKFSALIIPTQTLIGAWLLSRAFSAETGLALRMSFEALGWFVGLALASHWLLNALSRWLHDRRKLDALTAYDALSLVLLPPLVLIVSRGMMPLF